MTDNERMLKLAREAASSTENPKVSVPRDILNPGVYIGFILGWMAKAAADAIKRDAE